MFVKARGFTLIEILFALLIFAILSVTATLVLHSVFNSRARTQTAADRLAQLQVAKSVLDQDFNQIITVLAAQGHDPVIYGHQHSVSFNRGGYLNPEARLARSQLLHVSYSLSHSELVRQPWEIPHLDVTQQVLLTEVNGLSIRYLDTFKHWQKTWPIGSRWQAVPLAIEVNVQLQQQGLWRLLFLPPSGMPSP